MENQNVSQEIINKHKELLQSAGFDQFGFIILNDQCAQSSYSKTIVDYNGLHIYRFKKTNTNQLSISTDELKEQMFCFVYDSRSIKKSVERADYLCDKLKTKYPQYQVGAFVRNQGQFPWAVVNCIVTAYFENYEGDVLLALF